MEKKRRLGLHEVDPATAAQAFRSHTRPFIFVDATKPPLASSVRRRRRTRPMDRRKVIGIVLSILLAVGVLVVYPAMTLSSSPSASNPGKTPVRAATNPAAQLVNVQLKESRSARTSVLASGHTHINATYASGELIFYNSSSRSQSLQKGLTLSGPDGLQIALLETLTVPAGNLPKVGEASGTAQVLTDGKLGNIPEGSVNGLCSCGVQLAVKNLTFTGGQNAQNYSYLLPSDIDQAAIPLRTQVGLEVLTALQTQATNQRPVLLSGPSCSAQIDSSPPVGTRAVHATITVQVTCEETITVQQT